MPIPMQISVYSLNAEQRRTLLRGAENDARENVTDMKLQDTKSQDIKVQGMKLAQNWQTFAAK